MIKVSNVLPYLAFSTWLYANRAVSSAVNGQLDRYGLIHTQRLSQLPLGPFTALLLYQVYMLIVSANVVP